ncbi:AraC family transcriptional regulator [Bacteroides sp. 51]|uniref:AraC family transcriptional regulator n=1 Tax=Bacteroides sp. 51 TaxID=2302938 RepID=UPI0013D590AF|nr:helix-turn-helix domain-containing protein [Bacteroides sp. 51]NDV82236.1 AraC family transcriptional regulator [Bacteroides sp. 51]
MNTIPTRKSSEHFPGEIALMRYFSEDNPHQTPPDLHAHRDEYYIFLLVEEGGGKLLIDFEECEITEKTILCILPGQVHLPGRGIRGRGWFLAVDGMVVRDEYKEMFERFVSAGNSMKPEERTMNDLRSCAAVIYNRLQSNNGNTGGYILRDLLSSYIGMIAEMYQEKFPLAISKRLRVITHEFKSLLAVNYRFMKRPAQYAAAMNISAVYLYEVIKEVTGQNVGDYIRGEIVIQAKRLLFYTDMSVKEIALELGYEDWAYFTRLFTKISKLSPTQFRAKYLK